MRPKLKEMDGIVEMVYNSLKAQSETNPRRSLVILCGDHGMTEVG